jgi:ferrochelatase
VGEKIQELSSKGARTVLLVPIGFVSDHVEVLYDLDVKAKKAAEELGVRFLRAKTVGDHPKFIEMLAQLIIEKNKTQSSSRPSPCRTKSL